MSRLVFVFSFFLLSSARIAENSVTKDKEVLLFPPAWVGSETTPFARGLLWKIDASASSQQNPPPTASYLFGTVHSEDQRVVQIPVQVRDALQQSDRFCMELLPHPSTIRALTKQMRYADGQTLQGATGQTLFNRLTPIMEHRGVSRHVLTKYKPWAAYMVASAPPAKTGQFLDLLLYGQARQSGKSTCSLETVEEQVAVFEQTPLEDQLVLLQELVNDPQAVDTQIQKMVLLYLQGDLAGMFALSTSVTGASPEARRSTAAFLKRLLDERNHRMAERLLPKFRSTATFVAIGALHLPGPHGLLQLLADQGYKVSVIY